MESSAEVIEHLFACFDTLYLVLGESAPTMTNDANVVRAYEAGRAMGEVALAFREYLGDREAPVLNPLRDVMVQAGLRDASGALTLFVVASEVGPRVLGSLADALELKDWDEPARALLSNASRVLGREVQASREALGRQGLLDDPRFQGDVAALSLVLDESGNAQSFGLFR